MGVIFKVGEHEDFPPVPEGFPACGNWIPYQAEAYTKPEVYQQDGTLSTSEVEEIMSLKSPAVSATLHQYCYSVLSVCVAITFVFFFHFSESYFSRQ